MKEKLKYNHYKILEEKNLKIVNNIASARLCIFIIMIISFVGKYYYYPKIMTTIFMLSLIIFICLIIIHDKYYKIYDYYAKYTKIIENYLARENETWKNFPDTGEDFLKNAPHYYQDLDIFGQNSLFQYLSICKTIGGRETLKERLSNKEYSKIKLLEEQEAIKELSSDPHFMIDFSVLLNNYEGKKVHLSKEFTTLKNKKTKRDLIIACICSLMNISLLLLAITNQLNIRYFYGMFLFNFMISYLYTYIFHEEFNHLEKLVTSYKEVGAIFKRIAQKDFTSKKLNIIKKESQKAMNSGLQLEKLDTINSLRNNLIANFFLNGFFCLNLILLTILNDFENQDLSELKKGITNIEELESMCSLATIGIMFQNKCMPTINDEVSINFDTLIHPLLGEEKCVPNSFNTKNGINIITGSNMGGKTSFLRTVGINIILMNSGTFVCAKEFSASYLKIFTSMRVNDDISKGISTFYGELLRIKDMIEYVDKGNMLVLIDEIFKGTNYQDRIYGAKEVIKRLNTKKTIVLLTTHDFELCEEKNITNYHVEESYDQDKIIFDYKIKKGACTSTNAKYLMKKLGIIQKDK